ncbi:MAG: succinate dehydrogenase, cytochrome b556 subunit [Actinobacteria bacterium]|nr:succinate dehydrogenase, cytochrome b556 subunit [Actinomycetota bacterium]
MVEVSQRPVESSIRADQVVYKGKTGQWAFVTHRVTGFLVFMFLLLHIVDVSLVNIDADLYNEVHELYGHIVLRLFEVGLLFALVFHALNGLRIVVLDFFPGAIAKERTMTVIVVVVTILAVVPGGYIIIRPWLEGTF